MGFSHQKNKTFKFKPSLWTITTLLKRFLHQTFILKKPTTQDNKKMKILCVKLRWNK